MTTWTSAVQDPAGMRRYYDNLEMEQREAVAVTHFILQNRIDQVKEHSGDAVTRVRRKKKTWEEKLVQLDAQERSLKAKLEKLETEKSEAFAMFRKVLADEQEQEKKKQEEEKKAAAEKARLEAESNQANQHKPHSTHGNQHHYQWTAPGQQPRASMGYRKRSRSPSPLSAQERERERERNLAALADRPNYWAKRNQPHPSHLVPQYNNPNQNPNAKANMKTNPNKNTNTTSLTPSS
eukprot:m.22759 g.22759  ORF g.22759 m.22759 type:complete len:237 (+) comp13938_c0_seq1:67-777(+)